MACLILGALALINANEVQVFRRLLGPTITANPDT